MNQAPAVGVTASLSLPRQVGGHMAADSDPEAEVREAAFKFGCHWQCHWKCTGRCELGHF